MTTRSPNTLARALRDFFTDHLPRLRGLSPHTLQSYRDSLVLLLRFVATFRACPVAVLDLDGLGTQEVVAFLDYLEEERHNTTSTRNVRLAAIHAFFRYLAVEHPDQLERCQRILTIPFKRAQQRSIEYLEYEEIQALLSAINRATDKGQRDYALLVTMFNTGARVQEILDVRAIDLQLVRPFQVRLVGKGRKERLCPLWPQTAKVLRTYCEASYIDLRSEAPLFLNHRGNPLTRFGVRYILAKYHDRAKAIMPSLIKKRLHPHSMRHSTAVHLLKSGVDLITISHWLGHASVNTTHKYATIDLEMKRQALERARSPDQEATPTAPWRNEASILEWLEAL